MSTSEQLQALTEKLAALEAQLQVHSGAEAGGSSGAVPGQITVKVPVSANSATLWVAVMTTSSKTGFLMQTELSLA